MKKLILIIGLVLIAANASASEGSREPQSTETVEYWILDTAE